MKLNRNIFQSLFSLFLRFLGATILLVLTAYMNRNYPEKTVGQYDFIRTYLLVFGSITISGLDQSILYYSGKLNYNEKLSGLKVIYYKSLTIFFTLSIIPLLILLLIGKNNINFVFKDEFFIPLLKASATLFFYNWLNFNVEVFRAIEKIYLSETFRNILKYLIVFIATFLFVNSKNSWVLVDFFLLGFFILSIISYVIIFFSFNKEKTKSIKITVKDIFFKSYPMAISNMSMFLLISIDVFMLKIYHNSVFVAYYSTAVKVMTILAMVLVAINTTYSVRISEAFHTKNMKKVENLAQEAARIVFSITFPTAILIIIFSKQILYIFGENYVEAQIALIVLVLSQGLCSFFGTTSIYLNMTGREKIFQKILLCAVVLNFVLNYLLIPKYNINGAAISFSISLFFWNIVTLFYIKKKDHIKVYLKLCK